MDKEEDPNYIIATCSDKDEDGAGSITIGKRYSVIQRDVEDSAHEYVLVINDHGFKFWYQVGRDI